MKLDLLAPSGLRYGATSISRGALSRSEIFLISPHTPGQLEMAIWIKKKGMRDGGVCRLKKGLKQVRSSPVHFLRLTSK